MKKKIPMKPKVKAFKKWFNSLSAEEKENYRREQDRRIREAQAKMTEEDKIKIASLFRI